MTTSTTDRTRQFSPVLEPHGKRHFEAIDKTYRNNTESDYTEKIEALTKRFDYASNSQHYWGPPEFSTLYGTPLYDEASSSQKLALNHLYWVGQYIHTSASEANTMLYNQVTAGVFTHIKGYETLCEELDLETSQERYHVRAFQRVGYQTKLSLMGKESLGNAFQKNSHKKTALSAQPLLHFLSSLRQNSSWEAFQEQTFRKINQVMFKGQAHYYSTFLEEKGSQSIPTTAGGLAGVTASPSLFKFFTLSWGSSPFLAAQYYSARMIANMSLKAYEHNYFKYFRDLDKQGEFIPVPTAISYYHMLDESFHTTMSQVISQEVYKDFAKPTAYEKFLANTIIYLTQKGLLGGLSGGIPATFRNDASFMLSFYRLLRSPLFDMSPSDAMHWMDKCLCREHEGFHANFQHHQRLLSDFRRFFSKLDYLSPVNREMQIMADGGSIEKAIRQNVKAFKQFSDSLNLEH